MMRGGLELLSAADITSSMSTAKKMRFDGGRSDLLKRGIHRGHGQAQAPPVLGADCCMSRGMQPDAPSYCMVGQHPTSSSNRPGGDAGRSYNMGFSDVVGARGCLKFNKNRPCNDASVPTDLRVGEMSALLVSVCCSRETA